MTVFSFDMKFLYGCKMGFFYPFFIALMLLLPLVNGVGYNILGSRVDFKSPRWQKYSVALSVSLWPSGLSLTAEKVQTANQVIKVQDVSGGITTLDSGSDDNENYFKLLDTNKELIYTINSIRVGVRKCTLVTVNSSFEISGTLLDLVEGHWSAREAVCQLLNGAIDARFTSDWDDIKRYFVPLILGAEHYESVEMLEANTDGRALLVERDRLRAAEEKLEQEKQAKRQQEREAELVSKTEAARRQRMSDVRSDIRPKTREARKHRVPKERGDEATRTGELSEALKNVKEPVNQSREAASRSAPDGRCGIAGAGKQ
eukprot:GHVS01022012.1.p1 GENE.GHVS01022012.1~~GHVS01022012.1.p1  ORF type:complete len:316 (+),score=31.37 GHVS01022012.1:137-1084(+)